MIVRKCDICGEFFTPYLVSNPISRNKDSYYKIEVTERTFIKETGRTRQEYDVCEECKKRFDLWTKTKKRTSK